MSESIIIPTVCEAALIIDSISGRDEFTIQGKRFFTGYLNNNTITLCLCGIGKTNAAHGAAILFEHFKPSTTSVIGIAGAYPDCALNIGDIVVGEGEVYGDEGLRLNDGIRTMDALALPLASVGTETYYNEFPLFVPAIFMGSEHTGRFVTVSACSGTRQQGLAIRKRFNAVAENMEGAAIAHIGLLNNIPVAEIRGISNIIEDRQGTPLDKSALLLAAENVQKFFLERIIPSN